MRASTGVVRSIGLLLIGLLAWAQQQPPGSKADRSPRRLESVTWNSVKRELSWVISKGERDRQSGAYKPLTMQTYVINMDKATMTFNGETRGFSKQEAINVTALLDIIAKYAIESTLWWDQGHGQPVDEKDKSGVTRVSTPGSTTAPWEEILRRLEALERRLEKLERQTAGGSVFHPAGFSQ